MSAGYTYKRDGFSGVACVNGVNVRYKCELTRRAYMIQAYINLNTKHKRQCG